MMAFLQAGFGREMAKAADLFVLPAVALFDCLYILLIFNPCHRGPES